MSTETYALVLDHVAWVAARPGTGNSTMAHAMPAGRVLLEGAGRRR